MTAGVIDIPSAPAARAVSAGRTIHVAHVIEALGPGGAERLLYTNLKHFDRTRVRSTVITLFSGANHWRKPIEDLGVEVVNLDLAGRRELPKGISRLRAWLAEARPDLLHTHLFGANMIGRVAGRLANIPVISSVHNPDYEPEAWDDGSDVSVVKRKLIRAIDKWTARFGCDRMVAVSEYVRDSTKRRLAFPVERTDLLYNPIDAEMFSAGTHRNRQELLKELQLPADAVMLLNVARIAPQKGQLYAVHAMPEVLKRYPNSHLLLVGATTDPKWLEYIEDEISSLGLNNHVHITGARSDVPDLLRACDIFVFPSLYEGLGIALIEAMAAGCASVATRTGPLPEVVSDGVDGLLVPPRDVAALANSICELLESPERRQSIGTAAKKSALERFQPQEAAEKLTAIYERVVADH